MRCCLLVLTIWLWMSTATAGAADVVLGVVNAVDKDQGLVVLKVIDSSDDGNGQPRPESLSVTVNPDQIPDSLTPGDTVRIWGEYDGDRDSLSFRADSIRGRSTNNRRHDPTGVRSRLGRGGQGGRMGGGRSSGRR